MRREYAGITIEIPLQVVFLDTESAVPVFHRVTHTGHWLTTGCGEWLWRSDTEERRPYSWLHARHATRIGRPCTTCWTELRGNRSLWSRPTPEPRLEQETLA